jgi:hypothetical protein
MGRKPLSDEEKKPKCSFTARIRMAFPGNAGDGDENERKRATVLAGMVLAAHIRFPDVPKDDGAALLSKWKTETEPPTVEELRDGSYVAKLRRLLASN